MWLGDGGVPKRQIPSLDGLRTFSILLVFLGHGSHTQGYPHNQIIDWISSQAVFGVRIFFVISGFLITTLLLNEEKKHGRIDLKSFYLRRTLRIFPACYAFILVMAIVVRPSLPYLISAVTYTSCYVPVHAPWVLAHLWSLSVEEQFYLLWPAIVVFAPAWRKRIGLLVILLVPVLRIILWKLNIHRTEMYFPLMADHLMMGCMLAFYYPSHRLRFQWLKRPVFLIPIGLALVLCLRESWHSWFQVYLMTLLPLLIAILLFALIERADWILNNPVARAGGILSYSLYLWQQPFLPTPENHWWTTFPMNFILIIPCALLSYYLVERPLLHLYRSRAENRMRTLVAS